MKLYDESITGIYHKLDGLPGHPLDVSAPEACWPDVGDDNVILRGDMAYELGGGRLAALSGLAITSSEQLVSGDEVLLYGPDLTELSADAPYARIAVVRVAEDGLGEGNELYNAIRKIEYVRYHINPKGYMTRISASNEREPVRISKEAITGGINFAKVGKLFMDSYHKNPKIEAVKLIFITIPDFSYEELETQIRKNEQITATIDHVLKNLVMDCNACNLKPICDEVEGMKELHFAQSGQILEG